MILEPSPLKTALSAGRLVVGHMVMEFTVPNIASILRSLPLDFVLLDLEHTGLSLEILAPVLTSCRLAGLPPVVRVPGFSGHFISRCLDLGALGIMVPNVKSAADAREFVAAAKYAPDGRRGMGLGGAHTAYEAPDPREYADWANANTVLMAQIESVEAVDQIDDILAVPGIDVGWIGQMDLSLSLGIVGQYDDERFLEAQRRVAEACRRHGKGAGCQPGTPAAARQWYKAGFNVISMGTDLAIYRRALGQSLSAVRAFAGG